MFGYSESMILLVPGFTSIVVTCKTFEQRFWFVFFSPHDGELT